MSRAQDDRQQSFVLFGEHWAGLSILTDAQRGRLLQALYAWHGFCEEPELDQATKVVMAMMLPRMKANWELYQETLQQRRESGKKGGLAKASNAKQKLANASDASESLAPPSNAYQTLHGTGTDYDTGTGSIHESKDRGDSRDLSPVPPGRARAQRKAPANLRADDFERWYDAYPRKEKKLNAKATWDKGVKAGLIPDIDTLLGALAWQRDKPEWREPRYIPLPASYLNAGGWMDEPMKPAPNVQQRGPSPQYRPSQEQLAAQRTFQNGMDVLAELEEERRRKEENER